MSQVYNCLGYTAQCGQCAHTIKQIMKQVTNCPIASAAARTDRTRERNKRIPQPARSCIGDVPF
jgi:hypothetical protein